MEVFQTGEVTKFIQALPKSLQRRIDRTTSYLEREGHMARMPYSKPIGHGLFELRVIGAVHVRILYFFHENQAILVCAVIKKRNDLILKDIQRAMEVRKQFLAEI
jgi:hypothetical protein